MAEYTVTYCDPNTAASTFLKPGGNPRTITIPDPGSRIDPGRVTISDIGNASGKKIAENAYLFGFETYDVVILLGPNKKIYGSVSVKGQGSEDTAPGTWEADEEDPEQDKAGGHGKLR